jgi:hypothetical protein
VHLGLQHVGNASELELVGLAESPRTPEDELANLSAAFAIAVDDNCHPQNADREGIQFLENPFTLGVALKRTDL